MSPLSAEELGKYRDRLAGLIPVERIVTVSFPRPSAEVVEGFRKLEGPTPTISDILDSLGIKGTISASELKPIIAGKTIAGPATTLRYIPERDTVTQSFATGATAKLADRDAYAVAEPGDVVVIDAGGRGDISCMGGLSTLSATKRRLSGNIVDGGVRDVSTIRQLDYPVWARGITPQSGKFRIEAIEINGPVTCAGVQIRPGDLIIADDTGIVVVPVERAAEVLARAQQMEERENKIVQALNRGATWAELRKILDPSRW